MIVYLNNFNFDKILKNLEGGFEKKKSFYFFFLVKIKMPLKVKSRRSRRVHKKAASKRHSKRHVKRAAKKTPKRRVARRVTKVRKAKIQKLISKLSPETQKRLRDIAQKYKATM